MKPILLDLFCGAGGAAMGYARAGFEVVGVDIDHQPNYPFEFIQADWEEPLWYLPGLWEREGRQVMVHASPPCQAYSTMTQRWSDPVRPEPLWEGLEPERVSTLATEQSHPDLVAPVREHLQALGVPFVIENVVSAPLLPGATLLCGSMFGLGAQGYGLRRHRLFEAHGFALPPPGPCDHTGPALPVYGHAGGSSRRDGLSFPGIAAWREGMQIDWTTAGELVEAIPPAFTEWVGERMLGRPMAAPVAAGPQLALF